MIGLTPRVNGCTCDKISYFNRKCAVDALTGIVLVCDSLPTESAPFLPNPSASKAPYATTMTKYSCACCKLTFSNAAEQKAHYKSVEHVAVIGKNIPRPTSYGKLYETWSDSESNFSSESTPSESGIEAERQLSEAKPAELTKDIVGSLALFRNRNQEIIGIHRCLIRSQEAPVRYFEDVLSRVDLLRMSRFWAFLLYSGGKFAGAIFDENRVVVHKTFHRYTVRAKQGGSQTARDGILGGMSGHRSAGSALRRHGEMAIRADIANLLHVKWRVYLQACQLILTMTVRRNRSIFTTPPSSCATPDVFTGVDGNNGHFSDNESGEKNAILAAGPDSQAANAVAANMGVVPGDPRLRRLSGGIKSISYTQIKELQAEFSKFRVYEPHADLKLIALSDRRQMEEGASMTFESKSGRLYYGSLNELLKTTSTKPKSPKQASLPSSSTAAPIEPSALTLKKQKRQRQRKNRQKRQERSANRSESSTENSYSEGSGSSSDEASFRRADEWMNKASSTRPIVGTSLNTIYSKWMRLVCMATASGDTEELVELLNVSKSTSVCARGFDYPPDEETLHNLLNSVKLSYGTSLLHAAVELGDEPDVLDILLNAGCKLEEKDSNGMTPYQLAEKIGKRKLTTHLKKLQKMYPDRYDYVKAGFSPIQPPMTAGSMRRKKQATCQATLEATQKLDQMSMSEKCASAAEKRVTLGQREGKAEIVCNRCLADMTGKIPFSYLDFVFCSAECMRKHRQNRKCLT